MTLDPSALTGLLEAGGIVMWIIAALSIVALTLIIGKTIEFLVAGVWRRHRVETALSAWERQRPEAALAELDADHGPVASVVAVAIRGRCNDELADAAVREEVARTGAARLQRLRFGLRPLEVIGTLAPLLGLLGTVIGMIDAFRELEAAGSRVDPSVLSGGIWVALLTTAGGLSVAIPTVAAHVWLERQLECLHHFMQDSVTRVFTRDVGTTLAAGRNVSQEVEPSAAVTPMQRAGGVGAD